MSTQPNAAQQVTVDSNISPPSEQTILQPIEILLSRKAVAAELRAGRSPKRRKIFWLSLPANHPEVVLNDEVRTDRDTAPRMMEAIENPPYFQEHAFNEWPTTETMRMGCDMQTAIISEAEERSEKDRTKPATRGQDPAAGIAETSQATSITEEIKEWVKLHGSEALSRSVAERIECTNRYLQERLSEEREQWVFESVLAEASIFTTPPSCPPIEAFDLLTHARKQEPGAEMVEIEGPVGDHTTKFTAIALWRHGYKIVYVGDVENFRKTGQITMIG